MKLQANKTARGSHGNAVSLLAYPRRPERAAPVTLLWHRLQLP